ncbi:pyrimidine reductase family protein [Conyzicola sp.]|uniref:pyrimidine reductase family protein n=1 Tax=Conyzicola sp. TaxID=1969404 RepID=UPI0039893CDE
MTARIDQLWPEPMDDLGDDELIADLAAPPGPWLRVNFVSSVDGAATTAGVSGEAVSGGLGDAADKRLFELLRRVSDVVMVGAGTVRAEGYGALRVSDDSARWRQKRGLAAHPVFAIVSGSLDLDASSTIFSDAPVPPVIITTARASAERLARFDGLADVIVAGTDALDVRLALAGLHERGLLHVLNEGGPSLFGSLIAADAVDELCLTLAARLEAGDAPRIAHGPVEAPANLALTRVLKHESTLLLRYGRAVTAG